MGKIQKQAAQAFQGFPKSRRCAYRKKSNNPNNIEKFALEEYDCAEMEVAHAEYHQNKYQAFMDHNVETEAKI